MNNATLVLEKKNTNTVMCFSCVSKLLRIEVRKIPKPVCELRRAFFKDVVKLQFLQMLATTQRPELIRCGLTETEVDSMYEGKTPEGFSTHHKIPISLGGSNDVDNLCLMRHEEHVKIHQMIDWQISATQADKKCRILVPLPNGNFDSDFKIDITSTPSSKVKIENSPKFDL